MNFAKFIKHEYIGAGVVFITPQKEILLLQKSNNKWTFPGGHRELNEFIPLETAERECKEELGLMPEGKYVGKLKITKQGEEHPVYSFFMTVRDSFMPTISSEHKDYRWVDYKDIESSRLTSVFKPYWDLYKRFITDLP